LTSLLGQHEEFIRFVQATLFLQLPIHYGTIFVISHILFYYVTSYTELSYLTLISLFGMSILSLYLIRHIFALGISVPTVKDTPHMMSSKEVAVHLTNARFEIEGQWNSRSRNPTVFAVQAIIVLAILAYIGTWLSGYTLSYLFLFSVLVVPALYANNVLEKVHVHLQPLLTKCNEQCGGLYEKIMAVPFIKNMMAGKNTNTSAASAAAATTGGKKKATSTVAAAKAVVEEVSEAGDNDDDDASASTNPLEKKTQ
jgi:hypothetical protein